MVLDQSSFPLNTNESNTYIVKFEPAIDRVDNVQHILLQECSVPYTPLNAVCPQAGRSFCDRIAYAWGPVSSRASLNEFH